MAQGHLITSITTGVTNMNVNNVLWVKPKLPRGDLQLLKTCNASGVLRLTQAGMNMDWTTYFRNSVFGKLQWRMLGGKEVSHANFKIVLNGVDHGQHVLKISHKPSWESNQSNYTTAIHWGDFKEIKDWRLFGKALYLSRGEDNESYDFIITVEDKQ